MGEHPAYTCTEVGQRHLATPDDLAAMARLRTDWTVDQGGTPDPGFAEQLRDWWVGDAGDRRAWLARAADGAAVGMANLQVFHRMPRPSQPPSRWAYVANVWVDPAHRSRGVGRLVMTHVLDWARANGMARVVLAPSEMSVPLYSSLGFRPADDLMRLDLR